MHFLSIAATSGNILQRPSSSRRFGLLFAGLSFLLLALVPLFSPAPVQAQEANMVVLPDFVAQVKSLRFYPTDYGFRSFYERKYNQQFPSANTRHINWELLLDHPFKRTGRVNFTINAILYGPNGAKLGESTNEAWIESDVPSSQHTETWGADKPGFWKPGAYRVVVQIGGKEVTSGTFQVDGGPPATVTPPPAGSPPAEVAAFANLGATVTGIRFYPGPTKGVPYGQRQYTDKFDADAATFIFWEVAFDYPGTRANALAFPLTATWYSPAGKVMTTQNATANVKPEWDNSLHSHGYGSANPGTWEPGSYQVIIKVGDKTITSGNFQVVSSKKVPDFLANNNARVKTLRFFESGYGLPPIGQRNYTEKFVAPEARYINWELTLDLSQGKRTQRVNFPLHATWYGPDNKVLTTQNLNSYFEPDWPDSFHSSGYGSTAPGTFKPGIYRIVLKIEDKEVAQGSFQVMGTTPAQKDFLASIDARVESVKFYEGKDAYIPLDQRQYAQSFAAATARFMYVDLSLDINSKRTQEVTFSMETVWYGPDGKIMATTNKTARIAPDWPNSVHAMGYGRDNPGLWKPGSYRVVIKVDGKEVGSGSFQIY